MSALEGRPAVRQVGQRAARAAGEASRALDLQPGRGSRKRTESPARKRGATLHELRIWNFKALTQADS